MASNTKPTIVMVPGAWHPASSFGIFEKTMQKRGYETEAIKLQTVGNVGASVEDDAEHIRSKLLSHIEQGKDVLLISHSFAGFGSTGAIAELHKRTRAAKGFKGGLVGVVWLSSFLPPPDERKMLTLDMVKASDEAPPAFVSPNFETGEAVALDPRKTFYADVEPQLAEETIKTLTFHSVAALAQPITGAYGWTEADFDGCRGYILCLQDEAISVPHMRGMIKGAGVPWIVKEMNTSHSPFLSAPKQLGDTVEALLSEFKSA